MAKFQFSSVRWLFWLTAFGTTAAVSGLVGAVVVLFTPIAPVNTSQNPGAVKKEDLWREGFNYHLARPVNILVMGIDLVPGAPANSKEIFSGRSDTMLLLRLDPRDNSLKMLSIPRDTRVESAGLTIAKINQANVDGGSTLAAQVVSRTLNNVTIDRYVRISTGAFRELVTELGGIKIFVPRPMHYVDHTQNLKINLEPGWQTLNGDQAEQFARFRNDNYGDIGRVQRQQQLFKALRQRLVNPSVVTRLPEIVRLMWKYIDTNLSIEETLALANLGVSLQPDNVKMVMLPGRFSLPKEYAASYWIMNPEAKDRLMQDFFQQPPVNQRKLLPVNTKVNQMRIAIQNASGNPELSSNITEYLEKQGFQNIYVIQNWMDLQKQTQIIVEQGDLKAAKNLKKVLGLGKIEESSIGDIRSDLTIRVGTDWKLK